MTPSGPDAIHDMSIPSLEQVLACPQLPTLPAVAVEILSLTAREDINLEEIARVVQNDQALCAKILKTVNSSFYGLSKPCPSITRALTYLGLNTVKSLVLGFSLVDWGKGAGHGFRMDQYWRRCLYSAASARRIAALRGQCDGEEVFLAGLMQDVGMIAMLTCLQNDYVDIVNRAGLFGVHADLAPIERRAFPYDHPQVGAALAERWRFPDDIVRAIRLHHTADLAQEPEMARIVGLSSLAAEAISSAANPDALKSFNRRAEEWFNLTPSDTAGVLAAITGDTGELARLFEVNIGPAPDIHELLAKAEEAALAHQLNVQREAEALRQHASDLAQQAITDALTRVFNRNHFDVEMLRYFERARSSNGNVALLMIDADYFKALNDTFGHQAGDAALVDLCRRVVDHVGQRGIVFRYGGEEFAVILPGANRRAAAECADALCRLIAAQPIKLGQSKAGESITLTVSIGVAVLEAGSAGPVNTSHLLIQAADRALYAAKSAGRNCVRVFSPKPSAAQV